MTAKRTRLVLGLATLTAVLAGGLAAQAQQGGLFPRTRARVAAMEVLDRVYSRLHWEKGLAGSTLEVQEATGGVTVLRGTVPDSRAKAKAVDLARNTTGVTEVVDEISVLPPADPTAPAPVVRPGR